jgi:hypothetical protein
MRGKTRGREWNEKCCGNLKMIDYKKRVRKVYPEATVDHPPYTAYTGFYVWDSGQHKQVLTYDTDEAKAWKRAWKRIEQETLDRFAE